MDGMEAREGSDVRCRLLGGLEVAVGGRTVIPTSPKQRQVLALLLVNANRVTYVDSLARELWGDAPPTSVATTLQTYVYQLRKRLSGAGADPDLITTHPSGYLLSVPAHHIDVHEFQVLVGQAGELLDRVPERAYRLLRDALRLWRGPVLADVPVGPLLEGHAARLGEIHVGALESSLDAGLRLGRHHEVAAELRSLVLAHPYNERFHGYLMEALARSGRRSEALAVYQRVSAALKEDLGIDPSESLSALQREILSGRDASLRFSA